MPELTIEEKQEIAACLAAGESLPDRYRFLLFENKSGVELLWEGKTDAVCQEALPLQIEQRFMPERPDSGPEAQRKDEDEAGARESGWLNKLILGDNKYVLSSLLSGQLRAEIEAQGGIRLIYIDPPFCADADFSMEIDIGPAASRNRSLKSFAYQDRWEHQATFLNMMYERLKLMRELLAPDGSIYLHCDWRMNSCLRLLLDEIFGNFVNEICWHYTGGGRSARHFSRKHDSILVYSRSPAFVFNQDAIRVPYKQTSSYAKSGIRARSGKKYLPNPAGTVPDDVWDIPIINPLAAERLGYPTQKPESLLERIIGASSGPGDLVADFFCGSGTLPAVADRLGRKWIAVDSGRLAIHTTRKRILNAWRTQADRESLAPGFEIGSLGKSLEASYSRPAQCRLIPDTSVASAQLAGCRQGQVLVGVRRKGSKIAIQLLGFCCDTESQLAGSKMALRDGRLLRLVTNREGIIQSEEQIGEWLDWIDYWAVDYSYKGGNRGLAGEENANRKNRAGNSVFKCEWRAFRARKGRKLELLSPYREAPAGNNVVAVEVVDRAGVSVIGEINVCG